MSKHVLADNPVSRCTEIETAKKIGAVVLLADLTDE